jgi:hypothetical protein
VKEKIDQTGLYDISLDYRDFNCGQRILPFDWNYLRIGR